MAYNGSGDYSLPAGQPVVTGTTISSTTHNNLANDMATAFDTAFCRDGQAAATAAFDMGGFRIQNMAVGTGVAHAATVAQIQNSPTTALSSVAGTNTVTATASPTPAAYATGQRFQFVPANTNTGATTINISSLGAKNIYWNNAALVGGEMRASMPVEIYYDGTQFQLIGNASFIPMVFVDNKICDGRLTLTTSVPVTTSDVTAAETVYWTPFKGNRVALFDGTFWKVYTFTELSVDVPDATQMNDVFIYDNAGTLTLEVVAWTNDTNRATALATQNGVLVKTGELTKRYLGSFYSTTAGNGQTEDSIAKRYLWNYYNRVRKNLFKGDTTDNWNYSTAAWRQANASTANKVEVVIGVSEDAVQARVLGRATSNDSTYRNVFVGVGIDATNANSAQIVSGPQVNNGSNGGPLVGFYEGWPGVGRRDINWIEFGDGGGTQTWFGDGGLTAGTLQSGISGSSFS